MNSYGELCIDTKREKALTYKSAINKVIYPCYFKDVESPDLNGYSISTTISSPYTTASGTTTTTMPYEDLKKLS